MTFLDLCEFVANEMGVTAPTAVTSQTGDALRIVNAVKRAWLDMQTEMRRTKLMWKRVEFDTVSGTKQYDAGSDVRKWDRNSFSIYLKSAGETQERKLVPITYEHYKLNDVGVLTDAQPINIVIMPDDTLLLVPGPDAIYTIQGNYWKAPVVLAANGDTPDIKSEHHYTIADAALVTQNLFDEAFDSMSVIQQRFKKGMGRIKNDYLPDMQVDMEMDQWA